MSVGFAMLAHDALDRAGQVARYLADHGCPVVIHVDQRTEDSAFYDLVEQVSDLRDIQFAPRIKCDWGTWSLVEASRSSSAMLLDIAPDINNVCLISGACLPIKPVDELKAFLSDHPDTDFIESVTVSEVPWIKDGLGEERFTMTFPFAWKRQKRLFDVWVDVQRRVNRKRRVPKAITPHMGSQWWCLTRTTLVNVLSDPDLGQFDHYFRGVWIPDESYYSTLVRRHSRHIESRSLTLSKFDFQGKPHLFYDDHLDMLRQSPAFFARKVWPGARKLYGAFLGPQGRAHVAKPTKQNDVDRVFADAITRRTRGRAGLLMSGRFPAEGFENGLTAAPYAVFHGFDELFQDFPAWIESSLGSRSHGHLFAKDKVEFVNDQPGYTGCLPTSAALRDYNPEGFLTNLIWNTRGEHQAFLFSPRDHQGIAPFIARDPNAMIAAVSGSWVLPLLRSGYPVSEIRKSAARLQKREARHLDRLRERRTRARVRIWTLAEFMAKPAEPLQVILDDLSIPGALHMSHQPQLKPMIGLAAFLQELRNTGMNPHTAGAFSDAPPTEDIPLSPEHEQSGGIT
ncbi:MAG: glycosyl transferase [Boseongicola sp.]|nr:MAG: glycosyl transferase [Boseongicola sp.]